MIEENQIKKIREAIEYLSSVMRDNGIINITLSENIGNSLLLSEKEDYEKFKIAGKAEFEIESGNGKYIWRGFIHNGIEYRYGKEVTENDE